MKPSTGSRCAALVNLRRARPDDLREARAKRLDHVPEGFAHGYQTLEDATEAAYLVSHPYTPGAEDGLRHDDPAFSIAWPHEVTLISEKDAAWPDHQPPARPGA